MKNQSTEAITTFAQCRTSSYLTLGEDARREYEKACRFMIGVGTLRSSDLPVLATYAQAQVDIRKAQESIDELGLVILESDRNGHPKYNPNPAVKMRRDAEKVVANLALMLGFTPLGRKRLKGEESIKQKSARDLFEEEDD